MNIVRRKVAGGVLGKVCDSFNVHLKFLLCVKCLDRHRRSYMPDRLLCYFYGIKINATPS